MAIVGSNKLTAWFLLASTMGLWMCAQAGAERQGSKAQAADLKESSFSMPHVYQRWFDEDVHWIITPDERAAFLRLSTNQERDRFVAEFWLRRDPKPGTPRNEFKEEHYRRIAYANVHFPWRAAPGWNTDRGRIYIVLGPPDAIKSEPAAKASKPTESWNYRSPTKHGKDFKFVDVCGCGDYRLEPPLKD